MSDLNFYLVHVVTTAEHDRNDVDQVLNDATDWYRFAKNEWLVVAPNTTPWEEKLMQFTKPEGELFICQLDVTYRSGWMAEGLWQWIIKYDASARKQNRG